MEGIFFRDNLKEVEEGGTIFSNGRNLKEKETFGIEKLWLDFHMMTNFKPN